MRGCATKALLCQGHAQVIYSDAQDNYLTHGFDGRRDLNLDHVIPRDKGGLTNWENVVCSCIACNTRKGNRLTHEALRPKNSVNARKPPERFLCSASYALRSSSALCL